MLGRSLLLKEGPFVFLAVVCHISFLEYSLNPFPQFGSEVDNSFGKPVNDKAQHQNSKHSDKYIFYTLRFDCSFAAANTIKPQLL